MKNLYKSLTAWLLCLVFVFSNFTVSFADVNSLMIGTSSNALMTLELDDSDYSVMPMSSITVIQNTVEWTSKPVLVAYFSGAVGDFTAYRPDAIDTGDGVEFAIDIRDFHGFSSADYLSYIDFNIENIPRPGKYLMTLDLSNDFSTNFTGVEIRSQQDFVSASPIVGSSDLDFEQSSGDLYVAPVAIEITSLSDLTVRVFIDHRPHYSVIDALFKASFVPYDGDVAISTVGSGSSPSDFDYEISDSLSDLSSSVDSMTEDLSSAAENLEYISTSQNLIIQGIDNVVMHISDQLFAFWNQLFNLIHVPTMAKMDDIIDAINNMDLEIEVNLDGLKTTINNMSTAVQNKLQSTTDQITGGYDNSGIVSDQTELDSALNEYQQAEDELFDDAKDHLTNFEFDTPLDQFIKPIQDISYFMTGIFNGLAGLNIPIQFSLTLTIALILIGYYRIKR